MARPRAAPRRDALFAIAGKTSIDKPGARPVFRPFFRAAETTRTPLPGSSVAEQVTVNHLVAGSIPARAAISTNNLAEAMQLKRATAWEVIGIDEKEPIAGRRSASPNGGGGI